MDWLLQAVEITIHEQNIVNEKVLVHCNTANTGEQQDLAILGDEGGTF